MTGLITQGTPTSSAADTASSRLSAKRYLEVTSPKFARREVANAVAVHGQLHRFGRRRYAPAFLLELGEHRRVDCLDLRDDHVGPMLFDRRPDRLSV